MRYRKKPIVIDAVQLVDTKEGVAEVLRFTGRDGVGLSQDGVTIATAEGRMLASWGDWVIKGVQGEFYPCKPAIFEATYEAVDG